MTAIEKCLDYTKGNRKMSQRLYEECKDSLVSYADELFNAIVEETTIYDNPDIDYLKSLSQEREEINNLLCWIYDERELEKQRESYPKYRPTSSRFREGYSRDDSYE